MQSTGSIARVGTEPAAVRAPAHPSTDPTAARYLPQLDGLRAVSVMAVLLFHAGIGWMGGGYLGVSVFFTLSGFVVTTSIVHRSADAGGVASIAGFLGRRVRRLLPASACTLIAVFVLARLGHLTVSDTEMRWSAVHLANWHQLRGTSDYAELLRGTSGQASPLVHFWSLAIEEQFYLVWPFVLVVLTRGGLRTAAHRSLVLFGVGAVAVAAAAPAVSTRTVYFSSLFRVVEILAGCALALWILAGWRPPPLVRRAAAPLLGVVIVAMVITSDDPSAWPYRGLLPCLAVVSAALIASVLGGGRVATVLSSRPLVLIGGASYAIYLVHWPVFQLTPDLPTRLVATFGLAALLHLLVERPLRATSFSPAVTLPVAAVTAGALVALSTTLPPAVAFDTPRIDDDLLAEVALQPASTVPPRRERATPAPPVTQVIAPESAAPAVTAPATTASSVAPVVEPTDVVVFGDSTAVRLAEGLANWITDGARPMRMGLEADGACGVVRGGEYRIRLFNAGLHVLCNTILDQTLPATLAAVRPDVLAVHISLADTWERSWDGGQTWLTATDDEYADRIRDDYRRFVDDALALGVERIVWIRPPVPLDLSQDPPTPEATYVDGGQQLVEDTIRAIAAERPDRVVIADMRSWFEQSGLAADVTVRPDGIHLDAAAAQHVAEEWLGPLLLAAGSG